MARRTGLFGDAERESRLSQQRDYAAQLQEQVRAKQAQAEQDKARRRYEQARERELVDAQAQEAQAQAQRRLPLPLQVDVPPPPAAQQPYPSASSPARSPQRGQPPPLAFHSHAPPPQQRDHEIHDGNALRASSPLKYNDGTGAATGIAVSFGGSAAAAAALSPLVTTFTPGPSIFDSFFQSEPDRTLTHQLEALQNLRLEVETSWRQRRAAMQARDCPPLDPVDAFRTNCFIAVTAQAIAAKPQFIIVPSPRASASIPLSLDEKRQLDHEIDLSPRPDEEEQDQQDQAQEPELMSNANGLLGESVLIPLTHASPTKRVATDTVAVSPRRLVPSSPSRANSAVYRRLAAATAAAASASTDITTSSFPGSHALRHESELLHFDQ